MPKSNKITPSIILTINTHNYFNIHIITVYEKI